MASRTFCASVMFARRLVYLPVIACKDQSAIPRAGGAAKPDRDMSTEVSVRCPRHLWLIQSKSRNLLGCYCTLVAGTEHTPDRSHMQPTGTASLKLRDSTLPERGQHSSRSSDNAPTLVWSFGSPAPVLCPDRLSIVGVLSSSVISFTAIVATRST